jgi:hypothetical protein
LDRPYDREKYQDAARDLGLKVKTWDNEFCGYRYEDAGWANTRASQAKSLWRYAAGKRTSEVREGLADAFRSSLDFPLWVAKVDALFEKPIPPPPEKEVGEKVQQKLPPAETNVVVTEGGEVQRAPDPEKIRLAKRIDALEVENKGYRGQIEKLAAKRIGQLECNQLLEKKLLEVKTQLAGVQKDANSLRALLNSQKSQKPAPKGAGEGGAPAKAAKKAVADTGKKPGDAPSH